jgi:hypothetical protein
LSSGNGEGLEIKIFGVEIFKEEYEGEGELEENLLISEPDDVAEVEQDSKLDLLLLFGQSETSIPESLNLLPFRFFDLPQSQPQQTHSLISPPELMRSFFDLPDLKIGIFVKGMNSTTSEG